MFKIKDLKNDWDFLYDPKTKVLKASYFDKCNGKNNNSTIYDVECDNLVLAMMMTKEYYHYFDNLKESFFNMIEDPSMHSIIIAPNYDEEFFNSSFKEKLENAKKDYLRFDDPLENDDLPF